MNLKDRLDQAYGNKGKRADSDAAREGGDASKQAVPRGREPAASRGRGPEASRDRGPTAPTGPRTPSAQQAQPAPEAAASKGFVKETSGERGYRKVAKFLLLLGQEEAARVMRHMKREELEGIVREISTIKRIEPVEAQAILSEFGTLIKTGGAVQGGGSEAARDILVQAFGEQKGGEFLKRALPGEFQPFPYLKGLEAEQVLVLLKGESAHVAAVVLPQLEPKVASEALIRMEESLRTEIVKRMAKLEKIRPEVLASIDAALRRKAEKLDRSEAESIDGERALAGILRHLGPELEESILDSLEESDPELSASIRERLFTLEDVLRVRPLDLQRELRGLGDKELALLLKGKDEAFKEKLLSAVSKDRRAMVLDEYGILGSVRRQDVEEQTRDFISRLKRLHESGDLVLENDDDLVG